MEQSHSAQAMLEIYEIDAEDLSRIKGVGEQLEPRIAEVLGNFYSWLEKQPEFAQYFSDPNELTRVVELQTDSWRQFFSGDVDEAYIESRRRIGETHARIGLGLSSYSKGVNKFAEVWAEFLQSVEMKDDDRFAALRSISKLMHLEAAVVVETYSTIIQDTISAQAKSLMEMSTPVTQIWRGILLLPIVGLIDSHRAGDIMNATLGKIAETHAKVFILDISGVGVVDTAVANHLIKITRATALMGCACTISGVSPLIAQTIVDLGIDVEGVMTTATMQDALAGAFDRVGTVLVAS